MARPKSEHPAQVMSARVPYELAQLTRREAAALGVRVSARIRDGLRAVAGRGSSDFEKKATKELIRAAEKGTIAAVADVAGELLALAPNAKAAAHIEQTATQIADALSAAIQKTHREDKAHQAAKVAQVGPGKPFKDTMKGRDIEAAFKAAKSKAEVGTLAARFTEDADTPRELMFIDKTAKAAIRAAERALKKQAKTLPKQAKVPRKRPAPKAAPKKKESSRKVPQLPGPKALLGLPHLPEKKSQKKTKPAAIGEPGYRMPWKRPEWWQEDDGERIREALDLAKIWRDPGAEKKYSAAQRQEADIVYQRQTAFEEQWGTPAWERLVEALPKADPKRVDIYTKGTERTIVTTAPVGSSLKTILDLAKEQTKLALDRRGSKGPYEIQTSLGIYKRPDGGVFYNAKRELFPDVAFKTWEQLEADERPAGSIVEAIAKREQQTGETYAPSAIYDAVERAQTLPQLEALAPMLKPLMGLTLQEVKDKIQERRREVITSTIKAAKTEAAAKKAGEKMTAASQNSNDRDAIYWALKEHGEALQASKKKPLTEEEKSANRRAGAAKGQKTAGGTLPTGEVERSAAFYVEQLHQHLHGRPRNKSEVKSRIQALRAAGMARTRDERDALQLAQTQELKRLESAGRQGGGMFGEPIRFQQLLTARSVPELDRIQEYLLKTYPDESGAIISEARDVRKRGNLPEKELDRRSTGTPIARDFLAENLAAKVARDAQFKARVERLSDEALAAERRRITGEMASADRDKREGYKPDLEVVRAEQALRATAPKDQTPAQKIEAKRQATEKQRREDAEKKATEEARTTREKKEAKERAAAIAAEQKKNEAYIKRKAQEDAKEAAREQKAQAAAVAAGCEGPGCEFALAGGKCSVKAPLVVGAKEGGVFSAPARYCLIELSQLKPSHNSLRSYSRTPGYPIAAQERDYEHERGEQAKVQTIADNYEPSLVFNNAPGAIDGLPVANEQGIVLGGNGRTMATALVYGGHAKHATADTIKSYLKAHIREFGFTEKQLSEYARPMIVRTVRTGTDDAQELAQWSRRLNQSMSQALNPTLIAVSRARFLDPDALSELASLPDDETINAWLSTNSSRGFVRSLEKSGVIDTRNSPTFLVPGGLLSQAGRDLVNDLLVAVLIPDADLIRALGPGTTATLAKAAPYLAQLAPLKQYNILPEFTLALRDLVSLRAQGFTDVPRFFEQRGMFGVESKTRGTPIAEVWLFILFELSGSPAKLAKLARYYLGLAKAPSSGQAGLFAAETFTPQQALERAAKVAGVKL